MTTTDIDLAAKRPANLPARRPVTIDGEVRQYVRRPAVRGGPSLGFVLSMFGVTFVGTGAAGLAVAYGHLDTLAGPLAGLLF